MGIFLNSGFKGFIASIKNNIEHFVDGFGGYGWKLWEYTTDKWKLTIDELCVRGKLIIYELLVSKIRAVRGSLVISNGTGTIQSVETILDDFDNEFYAITLEEDEITFTDNDLIRCKTPFKEYWVELDYIEEGKIYIATDKFDGVNIPEPSDDLVQFGNTNNINRQSLIYLSSTETEKPQITLLTEVDSNNLTGKDKVRIDSDGLYSLNGEIMNVDSAGDTVFHIDKNGEGVLAKGAIRWNRNEVTFGSNVKLKWQNLDEEAQTNLKGEDGAKGDTGASGKDGVDANLLDWVEDWNTNATIIDGQKLITPKIFAGTNNTEGLTGVMIGNVGDYSGIRAVKNNEVTFNVDATTGDVTIKGNIEATTGKFGTFEIDTDNNTYMSGLSINRDVTINSDNISELTTMSNFKVKGDNYTWLINLIKPYKLGQYIKVNTPVNIGIPSYSTFCTSHKELSRGLIGTTITLYLSSNISLFGVTKLGEDINYIREVDCTEYNVLELKCCRGNENVGTVGIPIDGECIYWDITPFKFKTL